MMTDQKENKKNKKKKELKLHASSMKKKADQAI
jgi:hypothetical protein